MPRLGLRHTPPLDGLFTVNRDSMQARGLLQWFPMLASRGASSLRDFGMGASGTLTGCLWGARADRPALLFAGGTDIVDLVTSSFAHDNDFSVTGWGFVDSGSTYRTIWSDQNTVCYLGINGSNVAYCQVNTGSHVASAVNVGTGWHHLAMVKSSVAGLILYVDGVQAAVDATATGSSGGGTIMSIGAQPTSLLPWVGGIDDVRLYTRPLSAQDAYQLWAPQTRWELYQPFKRRYFVGPVGIVPPPVVTFPTYRMAR